MLSLGACNEDVKSVSTETITVSNYIIPDDIDDDITVQHGCRYNFVFDNVSKKMTIATSDLKLPDSQELSFTSKEFKFDLYTYENARSINFRNGQATLNNGAPVSDIRGHVTNIVNSMDYTGAFVCPSNYYTVSASYKAGNYTVRTFLPKAYFTGLTTTTYPTVDKEGNPIVGENKTKDCVYYVAFTEDMKYATVTLYNVQFADGMPTLQAIILPSLNVWLTRHGYEIAGVNIVPLMMEGGMTTPFPSKTFDIFSLKSSEDMREITCKYDVSKVFHGSFTGIYCDYIDIDF